jgi:acetyl esterase
MVFARKYPTVASLRPEETTMPVGSGCASVFDAGLNVDGQRMSRRVSVFASIAKRSLLAKSPPTPLRRRIVGHAIRIGSYVPGLRVSCRTVSIPGVAQQARLYEPEGISDESGLLVFVHGGGWHLGSVEEYGPMSRFIASKARVRVLAIGYRLAPEHPFPAAFDDAMAGYRYAVDHAAELCAAPRRIGIAGDSAGGNIAAAVALRLGADARYRPALAALIYPVLDCDLDDYESSDLFHVPLDRGCVQRAFAFYGPGESDRCDSRCSVMAAPDVTAMPPTYLATAGMDVLRDQGEAFGERLRESGCEVEVRRFASLPHGFVNTLFDGRARSAAIEIAEAVGRRLGDPR